MANPPFSLVHKIHMQTVKNPDPTANGEAAQPVDPGLYLAIERTLLTSEATQLGWIRTVIGLITAGFTIDKGTVLLHESRVVSGTAWAQNGHFAGLLLTITSTILLTFMTILYVRRMDRLGKMRHSRVSLFTPTSLLSIFICVVGGITIYFLNVKW